MKSFTPETKLAFPATTLGALVSTLFANRSNKLADGAEPSEVGVYSALVVSESDTATLWPLLWDGEEWVWKDGSAAPRPYAASLVTRGIPDDWAEAATMAREVRDNLARAQAEYVPYEASGINVLRDIFPDDREAWLESEAGQAWLQEQQAEHPGATAADMLDKLREIENAARL